MRSQIPTPARGMLERMRGESPALGWHTMFAVKAAAATIPLCLIGDE